MSVASRRLILQGVLFGAACACAVPGLAGAQTAPRKYVCPPCGCAADGKEFDAPGTCPECGMPLVPKPDETKPKGDAPAPPKARG
jgi:DNA-directed RNA polymerase subunit RPC12/RpoP